MKIEFERTKSYDCLAHERTRHSKTQCRSLIVRQKGLWFLVPPQIKSDPTMASKILAKQKDMKPKQSEAIKGLHADTHS